MAWLIHLRLVVNHFPIGALKWLVQRGRPAGIVANEQVQVAVVIVVAPGGAEGPVQFGSQVSHSGTGRHIRERAVVVVAEQMIAAISGDVEVGPTVVVVVCDGDPLPIAEIPLQSRPFRHIRKRAVPIVAVKDTALGEVRFRPGRAGGRSSLHGEDVQEAIVVVVEKGHAAARRLNKSVPPRRAVRVGPVQAGRAADVGKMHGILSQQRSVSSSFRVYDRADGDGSSRPARAAGLASASSQCQNSSSQSV